MKPPLIPTPEKIIQADDAKFAAEWLQFESIPVAGRRFGVQVRRDQPIRFWCEAVDEVEGKTIWKWFVETSVGMVETAHAEWKRVREEVRKKTVDEPQQKA